MAAGRNRPGFSRRAQYGLFISYVVAVAGLLVAAIILAFATLNPTAFASLRLTLAEMTTPISSGLAGIGRGMGAIPAAVEDHMMVRQKNAALRKELEDARALMQRARSLSYENRRLKALLRLRERAIEPVVAARLVSSSATSTRRFAVLNAGSWQGVRSGQPVRGPEGLIGQVVEAGPNTARVLLLTDPESIVPVRRTRDGLAALAAGRGDGLLDVRAVSMANAAFQVGDLFVTSGAGGIYPPNIPVARIVRNARDIAPARSYAQPDTLDFALVQKAYMPPPPTAGPANAVTGKPVGPAAPKASPAAPAQGPSQP